jgi:hypothetical protein
VLSFIRYFTGEEVISFGFSLIFIVLTFVLSVASYYWIEKPFRTQRIKKKKVLNWVLLGGAIFATSQTVAEVNDALSPQHLPIEYRRYADASTICHGKIVGECLRGDLTSNREFLVLGDLHAAMLNYFFGDLGKELGFKARVITASGCVTIPGFNYQRIAEWAHKPCLSQIEAALPYLSQVKTVFIAGVWNSQTKSTAFNQALSKFFSAHEDKQFIILSQVPRFTHDVNRVQRFTSLGLPIRIGLEPSYLDANKSLDLLASRYSHVKFWDTHRLPIFDKAPFYEGKPIYSDEHHLNEIGARLYADYALGFFRTQMN